MEGRVAIALRPARRRPALDVRRLDLRVPVVATALGDDGSLLEAAAADGVDGLVLVALGGGHVGPPVLEALRIAAARVPVVVALRPSRGAFLASTYGFEGAEGDIRATGAIPAGPLSPQAARMQLLACIGAVSSAPIDAEPRVLVCATDGEGHAIGARMVAESFAAVDHPSCGSAVLGGDPRNRGDVALVWLR